MEVFSKVKVEALPPDRPTDHVIDLEPGYKPPYRRIWNLSEFELKTLMANIDTNLASGVIQRLSFAAAAPFLCATKTDEGVQLCVDYRPIYLDTVKNKYPLLVISELLD
jgi:hypothetical protein